MRIKKVKAKSDGKIFIVYEVLNSSEKYDENQMTCSDRAQPEFYKSLSNLKGQVIDLCELPKEWKADIEPTGVTFTYSESGESMSATIIAKRTLTKSNSPQNIVTPHKAQAKEGDGEEAAVVGLPDKCIKLLEKVIEQAKLYIDGKREQASLDLKDKQDG